MKYGEVTQPSILRELVKMKHIRLIIADIHSNNNRGVCSGHYYTVAQNYKDLFGDVCEVKLASGPIYLKNFNQEEMIMLPFDHIAGEPLWKKVVKEVINLRTLLKKTSKDDIIVIQQGAPFSMILGLSLFYKGDRKLFQIQYSNQPMQSKIRRFFYRHFVQKKLTGTICPTDELGKIYGTSYIVIPDYVYLDKPQVCDDISYEKKQYDFCVVGRLNPDKGVVDVIKQLGGSKYKVLIAGRPDSKPFRDEILECCKGVSNIELDLGYISDVNYINYIKNSKYCILNYQAEYARRSSGVIFDILFNGTPVVAKRCTALSVIEVFNAGYVFDDISVFEPDLILSESKHQEFKEGIRAYQEKHMGYAEKLKSFILA